MLTLNIRGATVTIPQDEIERLWLASVRDEAPARTQQTPPWHPLWLASLPDEPVASPPAASTTVPGLPAIGSPWSGGVYAGIVRGDAGQRDYHLIVNTAEAEMLPWESAKAWAASLEHDGSQWSLPKRKEQAVLYGNLPELFAKEWYWSGEEYAPAAAYAWAQGFDDGLQYGFHRLNGFRARAVLHIPVGEDGR